MMCFICNVNTTPTFLSLIYHYKIIYLLRPHSSYSCKENNCVQSLSSFKKHIIIKHKFENIIDETYAPNEFIVNNYGNNFNVELVCSGDNNNIPSTINEPQISEIPNKNIFSINKSIEQLHLFAV